MASAPGCGPAPAAAPCSVAGARDATVSRPDGRGYVSLRPSSRFTEGSRTGRRTRIGGIVVVEAPSSSPVPEVGVVAARKVGSAVARNRAKRRLRAAISLIPLRPSRAYVVVASPEVIDVSFEGLVGWLRDAVSTKVTPGRGTT